MYIFSKVSVVVLVLQTLTFVTLISPQNYSSVAPPVLDKSSAINNATTINNTLHDLRVLQKNREVVVEGGGKIEMPVKPAVNTSQHHGREHVDEKPAVTNSSAASPSSMPPSFLASSKMQIHSSSLSTSSSTTATSTTERNIPIYEEKPVYPNKTLENSDHKKISARKGVNFTDFVDHKLKPKKPNVTIASEDEPYAASHFQSKSNLSATHSIPKVPNLDMLSKSKQGRTQKYVVPIVIVILSVPFVAILISILYKRGSEWWKYRHYRRMDFLINGMYDN